MLKTSLGKKFMMAVTGLFLMGFVVAHLLGNLQIFLGPDWLNGYSEHLEELPLLLWPVRVFLLLTLLTHMITAIQLAIQNKSARPIRYLQEGTVQATLASRTMVLTGLTLFLFIIYHLLHFTWGVAHPQYGHFKDAQGRDDVYSTVILSFRDARISAVYALAMFVLCTHLRHGSASFLQSLGWIPAGAEKKARRLGSFFGWLIFAGYTAIPVSAFLGLLKPLQGGG